MEPVIHWIKPNTFSNVCNGQDGPQWSTQKKMVTCPACIKKMPRPKVGSPHWICHPCKEAIGGVLINQDKRVARLTCGYCHGKKQGRAVYVYAVTDYRWPDERGLPVIKQAPSEPDYICECSGQFKCIGCLTPMPETERNL
jgi:hypothetical protein